MKPTLLLATLPVVLLSTACLPTLELTTPRSFTGPQVKQMQFDDACGMQVYFDRKPPRIQILEERAASSGGRTEAGRTRVLVQRGPQLQKLAEILQRYYRDPPSWLLTSDVTVDTDFLRRIPRAKQGILGALRGVVVIPTTSFITMTSGSHKTAVAYHPCLGELLFGRRTYRLRRLFVKPSPRPRRRATPRPAVRPDPRPAARPDPRPAVRPDPRPAVRPDPRPAARPDPRPAPRRPGLPPLPR